MAEGDRPKIDGDIWYASEVNLAIDKSFEAQSQNRYAQLYDGDVTPFNTLQADEWVAGFEVLTSAGDVDTGNTTMQFDSNAGYFVAILLDDFENDSIDATIWTTDTASSGTVVESGGSLNLNTDPDINGSSAEAITNGSTGLDFKTADSTAIINLDVSIGTSEIATVSVSNGSTEVDLVTTDFTGLLEIYFDTGAQTARIRTKTSKQAAWSNWGSAIDISSVTTNWYVRFYAESDGGGGGGPSVTVNNFTYVKGTVTQVIQSNGYDHLSSDANYVGTEITLDNGILTVNKELNGATPTWTLSSNDGSNFSSAIENTVSAISNASSQLVLKGSVQTVADRPAYIYEFGVKAWD